MSQHPPETRCDSPAEPDLVRTLEKEREEKPEKMTEPLAKEILAETKNTDEVSKDQAQICSLGKESKKELTTGELSTTKKIETTSTKN